MTKRHVYIIMHVDCDASYISGVYSSMKVAKAHLQDIYDRYLGNAYLNYRYESPESLVSNVCHPNDPRVNTSRFCIIKYEVTSG